MYLALYGTGKQSANLLAFQNERTNIDLTDSIFLLIFFVIGLAQSNEECLECHYDPEITASVNDTLEISAYVDLKVFENSIHGDMECIECHIDNPPLPAEITFSMTASDSGNSNPIWNHGNEACDNVYCHGAFVFNRDSSSNSWGYADKFMLGND